MSFRSKVTLAGLIALAAACNGDAVGPDNGPQQAEVFRISDGTPAGSGLLTRLPNGIATEITVDPGVIPAGDVVTLWGAIFNNPTECALATCDFPDMDNPAVEGSLVWLGSGIAGSGSTPYTGDVMVGDASGDILQLFGAPSPGPGLLSPAGAEIHVILRTHGPPISGALESQRQTFLGPNCTVEALPDEPCFDLLFVVFRAP